MTPTISPPVHFTDHSVTRYIESHAPRARRRRGCARPVEHARGHDLHTDPSGMARRPPQARCRRLPPPRRRRLHPSPQPHRPSVLVRRHLSGARTAQRRDPRTTRPPQTSARDPLSAPGRSPVSHPTPAVSSYISPRSLEQQLCAGAATAMAARREADAWHHSRRPMVSGRTRWVRPAKLVAVAV